MPFIGYDRERIFQITVHGFYQDESVPCDLCLNLLSTFDHMAKAILRA